MLSLILDSILKGTNDLDSLSKIYGVNKNTLIHILGELEGISIVDEKVYVTNKISLTISALTKGVSPKLLSKYLTWSEFESEVSRILSNNGYAVFHNIFFRAKRKWQIDVVGFTHNKIVVIDCKHWKKTSSSQLREVSQKHYERTISLIKSIKLAELALKTDFAEGPVIPVIVTFISRYKGLMNNVFIVPIQFFNDFLKEIDMIIDEIPPNIFSVKGIRNPVRGEKLP
jgi:hypothetical protein